MGLPRLLTTSSFTARGMVARTIFYKSSGGKIRQEKLCLFLILFQLVEEIRRETKVQ
jgi:hypothetical protein